MMTYLAKFAVVVYANYGMAEQQLIVKSTLVRVAIPSVLVVQYTRNNPHAYVQARPVSV